MSMRWLVALVLTMALGAPCVSAQEAGPIATTYKFRSAALRQERRVHVYTPPGYATSGATYPVLYLLDGGLDQWLPSTIATLDAIASEGQTARLVIVGIASFDREFDFAKRPDQMREFLESEVKPIVEGRYRTRGKGMIFGWSLGGLFVVDTLLHAPDLFDEYVAVSPSLWRNKQALARSSYRLLPRLPAGERRLWLSRGDEGPALGMGPLIGGLKAVAPATLRWTYAPLARETHGTVFLPALRDAVRAFHPASAGAQRMQVPKIKSKG